MTKQTTSNVPRIRFKGFDGGWDERALAEISEIKTGPFGSALHAKDYVSDGVPIITTEHFKFWRLPETKKGLPQVSNSDYKRLMNYVLRRGDIVFSRVGSIDINAHVEENQEGWLFSGRVLRVRTPLSIDSEYLHHELSTVRARRNVAERAVGQTMPCINTGILGKTVVFLPKQKPEQTRIRKYLRKLDNLIGLQQRKHERLLTLKKAMLQKMFPQPGAATPEIRFKGFSEPWEVKTLGDVAYVFDGTHQTPQYTTEGIMFLSVENIHSLRSTKFISKDAFKNEFKTFPQKGDVLMTRIGDIGTANVVESDEPVAYYVSLALLKLKSADPYFIKHSISSESVTKALFHRTLHIAFPKKINKNEIEKVEIQLPQSKPEQQKIGTYFRTLDKLISQHATQLQKLRQMKSAFLEKMFV